MSSDREDNDKKAQDEKAQKELDESVEKFLRDTGWNSGGVLVSYVLIMHSASYDTEGFETSQYGTVLKGGSQPEHVVLGLLEKSKYELILRQSDE